VKTSYQPAEWTPITGGIGLYDPNLATPASDGPSLSSYVLGILSDYTKTYQATPISQDCQESSSCSSYLILGGVWTVSPWPFRILNDTSLTSYITKDGPAYQIDFWDAPRGIKWGTDVCTIFGPQNSTFQLCVSSYNTSGINDQLVAGKTQSSDSIKHWSKSYPFLGIRPCLGTVLSNGTCDQKAGWDRIDIWSTFMSIYRRTATVTSDRSSAAILDVSDLGDPVSQNLTAEGFTTALNAMLYKYTETNPLGGVCPAVGSDWQLTVAMSSAFENSLLAPQISTPMNILRNLFATPLFVFNSLVTQSNPFSVASSSNSSVQFKFEAELNAPQYENS